MELLKATLKVVGVLLVTSSIQCYDTDIETHLEHLRTQRYPTEALKEARKEAKEYIIRKFEEYKLRVHLQHLTAFAASNPDCSSPGNSVMVHGHNIIGISDSGLEDSDSVIVLGVAYDTDGITDPIRDNGVGVAVMLETARLYQSQASRLRHSTLFIAFDLSVPRYRSACADEYGTGVPNTGVPGAWIAVQDYLRLYVSRNASRIGGGIVLGSVSNVRGEEGTQGFEPMLQKLFPDAHKVIEEGGSRGDFLAMVTRQGEEDGRQYILAREVADSFQKDGGKLLELNLRQNPHTLLPSSLPLRETVYFWNSTYMNTYSPLPAILLTDTEGNRAPPPPPPLPTDTHQLTETQKVFLNSLVNGLVTFLVHRQAEGTDWMEVGLLTTLLVSGSVNLMLFIHLYHLCKSKNVKSKKETETYKLKVIKHHST